MFKRNQLNKSLIAASLMVASSAVLAQETLTSQASITVQNAFDLTETTPLSFGTVRASAFTGENGTLTLLPDGSSSTADDGNSAIAALVAGTPGEFAIANASSFTDLTVTLPADNAVSLVNSNAPGTTATFELSTFQFADADTPGTALAGDGTQTVTTDVNGEASILVGATIESHAGTTAYVDGDYTANYTVQVEY